MKPSSSFPNRMQDKNDKNMNELFQNLRSENYDSSFDEFSFWLRKKTLNNQTTMKNSFNIKYFLSHNRLKLAIITFLLLTIAACNMPVNSTSTLGYLLSWNSSKDRTSSMVAEVEKLDVDKKFIVTYNIRGNDNGQIDLHQMILQDLTGSEAENIQNKIGSVAGVSDLKLTPMTETQTEPLYSYAMKNLLKIEVNSDGKSDQQVADEINKQLQQAGYSGTTVHVESKNGVTRIMLDESTLPAGGNVEINVNGTNTKEVMKMKKLGEGEKNPFESMTDEQIKAQVKKDNPGIQDNEIHIERVTGKDGKQEVKIKIEHDEKRP